MLLGRYLVGYEGRTVSIRKSALRKQTERDNIYVEGIFILRNEKYGISFETYSSVGSHDNSRSFEWEAKLEDEWNSVHVWNSVSSTKFPHWTNYLRQDFFIGPILHRTLKRGVCLGFFWVFAKGTVPSQYKYVGETLVFGWTGRTNKRNVWAISY